MLIPEDKVQEILERTDIVGLVGARVELRRAGRSFKALCPFHGERTPSFTVNPDRRRFKCFGCGASGDAIAFVMKSEGKSFVEASRELAGRAGVRLDDAGEDGLQREKLDLRRVNALAMRYFMERLWDPREGAAARTFLKQRGVTGETARQFSLGYATAGWSGFSLRAKQEGMLELAIAAGLVSERKAPGPESRPGPAAGRAAGTAPRGNTAQPGSLAPVSHSAPRERAPSSAALRPGTARPISTYDFFRDRIMIPIRNADGTCLAFGGRSLQPGDARKFMNSRDSAIYKKGDLLFGIDRAAPQIRKTGQVLLVEGYFDALVLNQAGIQNAVALCSAALTADQLKLLGRLDCKEIVLILDGDEAGRRGVGQAAAALLTAAIPTRVMVLPTGKDPDEYVLEIGATAFSRALAAAIPLTEHLIRAALPTPSGSAPASFEDKLRGFAALAPILVQVPDGLERALFLRALSERLGVPQDLLAARLAGRAPKPVATAPNPTKVLSPGASAPKAPAAPAREGKAAPLPTHLFLDEVLLVAHLLHDPELARLEPAAELEQLSDLGLRAAAAALLEGILDGKPLTKDEVLAAVEPAIRTQIEAFLRRVKKQLPHAHREEFLQRCKQHHEHLERAESDAIQAKLRALAQQIAAMKRQGASPEALAPLRDEHLRLTEEKQALARGRRPAAAPAPEPLTDSSNFRGE